MKSLLASLTLVLLCLGPIPSNAADRPNFLFLLSDDQAWNGLSCQMHPDMPESKSRSIETPNIARLASEGMRFSAGYSPASVCAPTRISLQTGKSPAQCHWTKAAGSMTAEDGFPLIPPRNRRSIDAAETTIGELLQSAGYTTAHFGKWHISGGGPENHGYDKSDGDTGNQDAAPHLPPNPVDIFGMGERAMALMTKSKQAGKPFYIQMSYHALHYPENAPAELVEKYANLMPNGNEKEIGRAAMSEALDQGVGMLLEKVEALGIADHTYVIYMSDNGSSTKQALRGGKGGVWEGGIRVPFFVRGPGIAANSWSHQRVIGYDLYPTLCELAGVERALPETIEGGSITHLFQGKEEPVKRPREELVFHFPHYQGDTPHSALLLDHWKIIHFYETGETHLFDLDHDIAERNDLAKEKPEVAGALEEKLFAYLAEVRAQMPEKNPRYDPGNPPSLKENRGEKKSGGEKKRMKQKGKGADNARQSSARREDRQQAEGGADRSPLFDALDSNGDREISAAELANAGGVLKTLDRNKDGQLERDEFSVAAVGERGGQAGMHPPRAEGEGPRTPWILVHAPEIDANRDGVVEFETEMMAEASRVFAAFDRNSDEKIMPNESGSKKGIPRSALGGFVREHAAELDRDQDGGISKEELTGLFARFFAQADKNGDQKLTREEYEVEGGVVPRFPEGGRESDRPKPRADSPTGAMRSAPPANRLATAGPDHKPDSNLPDRPNIVLFLIDDMGWNAMGFTGNPWIETPRTDAMARKGMIFTNAYASAPNCAPTRACLMSGQYTPRHGVYTVVDDRHSPGLPHHKVLAADSNAELATESVTIAESLKASGYATGMFGMWNLGRGRSGPTTPLGQGFEVFKQPRDLGFEKDRYRNDRGEYLTDALTEEGIRWIETNRERNPFFLYLAYHGVHSPFEPKPDLLKKYREKPGGTGAREEAEYAATVEAVDQNVGRIVDALERLGLDDDTIVIFHSDNGGNRQYIEPLAGGKGTLYEGGIRVPTAIWGPGVAVGEATAPMLSMDLYPTILDLTGTPTPERHRFDGETLRPILTGESDRLKRDRVFWHFPSYIGGGGPSSAMRQEDWKVIEHFDGQRFEVFDLSRDPQERRNLLEEEPEKARELVANLRRWQEQTKAPRPTHANPAYDPNAQPERGRDQRKKGEKRGK